MDGIIMEVREGWKMGRFLCTREFTRTLKRVGKVRLYLGKGARKLCLSDWRALHCKKGERDFGRLMNTHAKCQRAHLAF